MYKPKVIEPHARAEQAGRIVDSQPAISASIEHAHPEPFVDAEHAGRFLQLQPRRVMQLARQGKLPAYPVGNGERRVWRFRLSDLASAMLHSRQRSHVPEEI